MSENPLSELLAYKDVLIVEDEEEIRRMVKAFLKKSGFSRDPVEAANGQEALNKIRNQDFALIISDIEMPNMDGYTASSAIRSGEAGEAYKEVPIIAMTANALAGDREKCLQAGMSDYIAKPVNFEHVEAAVKKWLGGVF